jgi:hypothetical protein
MMAHGNLQEVGADRLLLTQPVVENARNIIDLLLQRDVYEVINTLLQQADSIYLLGQDSQQRLASCCNRCPNQPEVAAVTSTVNV